MTSRGGRTAAGLTAGIAAALLLGGLAALPASALPVSALPVVAAADPAPSVGSGLPLRVSVTAIDPVIGPGQDLHLTVEVRNDGTGTVTQPRMLVHLARSAFISRFSLDEWRNAPDDGAVGTAILIQDLPAPLAPGQTASADVVVPAASIGLPRRATSWGARGLAVQLVDAADPARVRLGLERTFLLWFPEQDVTATRLSLLAPVTGIGVDPLGGTWVADLEQQTGTGGRLATLLDATADHPEVTWAVDPWLADPTSGAGPHAQAWAGELRRGAVDREVLLLPYLDPDVAALAHAGATGLLRTAVDRAEATDDGLPDSARATITWPADDLPDLATAALADRAEQEALLVGPGELQPPGVLTYTPSGRTTVPVQGDDLTVLVPDERLSAAFRTGDVGEGVVSVGTSSVVTPATAGQDLLAELAVITRERPSDGRHMLVTMPRDWTPDTDLLAAQLDAVAAAPWVHVEPVSALLGLADPEIERGALPDRVVDGAEVDVTALGTVRDAVERRTHLASIVADPGTLLGDLELEQLAPTSVAWRADPQGRAQSVQASYDLTRALSGAVTVQPPPTQLNLTATSGRLPVRVTNTLDQPVTVVVGLRPYDPRLIADETVTITLAPGTDQLVTVPVRALQSSDYRVAVELRTPDGTVLDDSTEFTVGVRAEWETIGTAVLGGLLALGLIVGLVRTVRRGRSRRRARPQTASGPDALSPEEQAEHAVEGTTEHTAESTGDGPEDPPVPHLVQGRDDDRPPAQEAPPT